MKRESSPLVLSPARHGAGRRRIRPLGTAAPGFPDQAPATNGSSRARAWSARSRISSTPENQIFHREFDQWAKFLQTRARTPFHRSYVQAVFDSYLREEVVPFTGTIASRRALRSQRWARLSARTTPRTASSSIPTSSSAASRCPASTMCGTSWTACTTTILFQQSRRLPLERQRSVVLSTNRSCDIHISTGTGPWENSGPTYRLSEVLLQQGDPPLARQLGTAGRPRLAVLEAARNSLTVDKICATLTGLPLRAAISRRLSA